ncbi:MAG: protein kinase [Acidobacteriota bacterium]
MRTDERFGRYAITSKIGEGGMGEVYSAHDVELDRTVAIKLLPGEFTEDEELRVRFRQEARVVSALNHPNIITIFEIGENEHGSFLATEFVEGRTLREIIQNESITLTRILRIVEQTAQALVAAHEAKIVHRDIKPENIMVRRDSIVKVLDFGLAKPAAGTDDPDDLKKNKTVPGTVMGSARYMSPEQARGLTVDERTDIWSLGVVMYEMLTGSAPFNGETTADTIASVVYQEPEPIAHFLPGAPPELHRILRKALQKDREERYQSVKDLALDVKELLFEIEHENNSGRQTDSTSSPAFTENPTIIHKTISANHPTDRSVVMPSKPSAVMNAGGQGARRWPLIAAALILLTCLPMAGYGLFNWYMAGPVMAENAFDKPQISRINTDGKVLMPAISNDGKYVAYVSGELGARSLVVRQIATDSVVTVGPTTNVNFWAISFSPTGDHLYYSQTRSDGSINTLYRVPTLGGTPKKLIDDVDSAVTFSPDGQQFAFMRHTPKLNEDVIFVVDTATLEMQQLIGSTEAGYDFFSNRLAWSPDGRRLLLGAGKRQGGTAGEMVIAEVDIKEKTLDPLDGGRFFAVGNFAWFSDGSGYLCRENQTGPVQIWRSSYPTADFHPVTNDFNDYAEIGLAADGKMIVALKADASSSLWRIGAGEKEAVQLTVDGRNPEGTFGIAQTAGGRLVYTRANAKESDIWISDADGKNGRSILSDFGAAVVPVITPDEKYIVFNRQKGRSSKVWRMDADGKNPIQLTDDNDDSGDFSPQVSADGQTVIFQRQYFLKDKAIFMKVPIGGGAATELYTDESMGFFAPRLSPDGKRIAFGAYDVNNFEKKLMIAPFTDGRIGTVERQFDYNLITQFAWSPDSKSLTILTSRAGVPNLWRQHTDGSAATPITDFTTGRIYNFAWSADGKHLLIARGSTNNDLLLVRDSLKTGKEATLTFRSNSPAARSARL